MNKTNLLAALCMIGLLIAPIKGFAEMVPLTDGQLSEIIGQAGIDTDVTHIAFNTHDDNISVLNGVLNLGDVTLQGSIDSRGSTSSNLGLLNLLANPGGLGMKNMGLTGFNSMGLGTHMIDMTINIDRFSIGAIRIGNDTNGPSLGSLYIGDLRATIKGSLSVTAH